MSKRCEAYWNGYRCTLWEGHTDNYHHDDGVRLDRGGMSWPRSQNRSPHDFNTLSMALAGVGLVLAGLLAWWVR